MQNNEFFSLPPTEEGRIVIVVPCFNEELRFRTNLFLAAPKNITFCFVDDGSSDNTSVVLETMKTHGHRVVSLPENRGKAEAVRSGMNKMLSEPDASSFKWIGYWDADLATPIEQIQFMLSYHALCGDGFAAIVGSRVDRRGSHIHRSIKRHLLGRFFATATDLMFSIGAYDTQCGAKIFRTDIAKNVFREPFVSKWIFDVEVFLRLRDNPVLECPLAVWEDISGSKIKILKVALQVVRDLALIKKNYVAERNYFRSHARTAPQAN